MAPIGLGTWRPRGPPDDAREDGSAPGGRPGRFQRLLSCSKRDEGDGVSNTHDAARELKPKPERKQDRRGTTRSSWTRGRTFRPARPTHYVPTYRDRPLGCFTKRATDRPDCRNCLLSASPGRDEKRPRPGPCLQLDRSRHPTQHRRTHPRRWTPTADAADVADRQMVPRRRNGPGWGARAIRRPVLTSHKGGRGDASAFRSCARDERGDVFGAG
ncbi:MAG: hypothetical protein JWL76_1338 [Thermoleophilia bacterium]|nr:hypothetical protein [Thermoleophilia bacterium]